MGEGLRQEELLLDIYTFKDILFDDTEWGEEPEDYLSEGERSEPPCQDISYSGQKQG